jgi:hypothetical protein
MSLVLGVATIVPFAATPSEAHAQWWGRRAYPAYSYYYPGTYAYVPNGTYYTTPSYSYYYTPGYSYDTPGYSTYYTPSYSYYYTPGYSSYYYGPAYRWGWRGWRWRY